MSVSSRALSSQLVRADQVGVAVQDRRVCVDGVHSQYLEAGSGPPLLLLHGHEQSATSWRWVLPVLARTHRVLALSLPGHGDSAPAVGGYAPGTESRPRSVADFLDTVDVDGRCMWSGTRWVVRSPCAWPWLTRLGCRP